MSRCRECERKSNRPCSWSDRTQELAEVLIPALRNVAYRYGYALAVHGSLNYDIDLVAVPWRETAIDARTTAEAMRVAIDAIVGLAFEANPNPTKKPCGRLAWSFHLGGGPYVDLSIMPRPEDLAPPMVDTSDYPWLAGESK